MYFIYRYTYIFSLSYNYVFNYLYRLNRCKNYQSEELCNISEKTSPKSPGKNDHSIFCVPLCYINTSFAGPESFCVTRVSVWVIFSL